MVGFTTAIMPGRDSFPSPHRSDYNVMTRHTWTSHGAAPPLMSLCGGFRRQHADAMVAARMTFSLAVERTGVH